MEKNLNNTDRVKVNLAPEVTKALQEDKQLMAFYRILYDLYNHAIPKVIEVSPNKFIATYGDEFNTISETIQLRINQRQNMIINSYMNNHGHQTS